MALRTAPSRGGPVGLGMLAGAAAIIVVLLWLLARSWPGPLAAVLALVVAALIMPTFLLAYWVWGYFSLRYDLSRDGITIKWAASRLTVPMLDITHILNGRPLAAPVSGIRWPGYEIGRSKVQLEPGDPEDAHREALVYATAPTEGQLVIVTHDLAYVVSPADRRGFVREFQVRRRLGTVQRPAADASPSAWGRLTILRDTASVRLVAIGVAVSALAFAWLIWHYPELPGEVALLFRFDPATGTAAPGPAQPLSMAWTLPLVGTAGLVLNTILAVMVHERTELGSRLLIAGAIMIQLAVFVVMLKMA